MKYEKNIENKLYLRDLSITSGLRVASFFFNGEEKKFNSYANMQALMFTKLYNENPKCFHDMAEEKYRLRGNESRIYISYDAKDLLKPKELNNTGVFFECGSSSSEILSFIQKVLSVYDFEDDDFYFIAKEVKKSELENNNDIN